MQFLFSFLNLSAFFDANYVWIVLTMSRFYAFFFFDLSCLIKQICKFHKNWLETHENMSPKLTNFYEEVYARE